jgi:hypothetical protein
MQFAQTVESLLRLVLPKASLVVAPYGVVSSVIPELQPQTLALSISRGGKLQFSAIRHPTFLVCHGKPAGLAIPMARTAALAVCQQGPAVISESQKNVTLSIALVFRGDMQMPSALVECCCLF